jgi:hypothetical protein
MGKKLSRKVAEVCKKESKRWKIKEAKEKISPPGVMGWCE